MADNETPKSASYKIYDGSKWVEYYFKTSAALVGETTDRKFVSPDEKATWNAKQSALSATNKLNPDFIDFLSKKVGLDTRNFYFYGGNSSSSTSSNSGLISWKAYPGDATDYTTIDVGSVNLGLICSTGKVYIRTENASAKKAYLSSKDLTADRTFSFPDKGGTLAVEGDFVKASGGTFTGEVTFNSPTTFLSTVQVATGTITDANGNNIISEYEGSIGVGNRDATIYLEGTTYYGGSEIATVADIPSLDGYATEDFVNSSIATNTANFLGTYTITQLGLTGNPTDSQIVAKLNSYSFTSKTNNDYVFVQTTDTAGNTSYKRFKWTGSTWAFEYNLNNSSFTAVQWNAINSGITSGKKVVRSTDNTAVGSSTTPVYIAADGTATALSYTIEKSVPSNAKFTDTDTKNTAGAQQSTSKLFLIGAAEQKANPTTYSNAKAYISENKLYSDGKEVSTSDHTHNTYLPLTGGTLTGALNMNNNKIKAPVVTDSAEKTVFKGDTNGVCVGYQDNSHPLSLYGDGIYFNPGSKTMSINGYGICTIFVGTGPLDIDYATPSVGTIWIDTSTN